MDAPPIGLRSIPARGVKRARIERTIPQNSVDTEHSSSLILIGLPNVLPVDTLQTFGSRLNDDRPTKTLPLSAYPRNSDGRAFESRLQPPSAKNSELEHLVASIKPNDDELYAFIDDLAERPARETPQSAVSEQGSFQLLTDPQTDFDKGLAAICPVRPGKHDIGMPEVPGVRRDLENFTGVPEFPSDFAADASTAESINARQPRVHLPQSDDVPRQKRSVRTRAAATIWKFPGDADPVAHSRARRSRPMKYANVTKEHHPACNRQIDGMIRSIRNTGAHPRVLSVGNALRRAGYTVGNSTIAARLRTWKVTQVKKALQAAQMLPRGFDKHAYAAVYACLAKSPALTAEALRRKLLRSDQRLEHGAVAALAEHVRANTAPQITRSSLRSANTNDASCREKRL